MPAVGSTNGSGSASASNRNRAQRVDVGPGTGPGTAPSGPDTDPPYLFKQAQLPGLCARVLCVLCAMLCFVLLCSVLPALGCAFLCFALLALLAFCALFACACVNVFWHELGIHMRMHG
jgi:hypothetical protein